MIDIILHGLSEYLGVSCSNNIGLFLWSRANPSILSQFIIFKYILSWFALFDIVVNIILFLILSYAIVISPFNKLINN